MSRVALPLIAVSLTLVVPSCIQIPDQSQFAELDELADSGEALVRVYSATFFTLEDIATHTWIVLKRADSTTFDRWELFPSPGLDPEFGLICFNCSGPEDDVGGGNPFVSDEIIGPEAVPIIDFIEQNAAAYPCREFYFPFPGPNSNTFIAWILDSTRWDASLPPSSIGQNFPVICRGEAGGKSAIEISIADSPSRVESAIVVPVDPDSSPYEFTFDDPIQDGKMILCCFSPGEYDVFLTGGGEEAVRRSVILNENELSEVSF